MQQIFEKTNLLYFDLVDDIFQICNLLQFQESTGGGGGVLIIGLSNIIRSFFAALDRIKGLLSNAFSDLPEELDAKAGRRFQMSFLEQEKRGSIAAPAPQANQSFYCYSNLCFFLEAVLTCYCNR